MNKKIAIILTFLLVTLCFSASAIADNNTDLPHVLNGEVNVSGGPFEEKQPYEGTIYAVEAGEVEGVVYASEKVKDGEYTDMLIRGLEEGTEFEFRLGPEYMTGITREFEPAESEIVNIYADDIPMLEADIEPSATAIEQGESVEFDASGSKGSIGVVEFSWDFGTGDTDTGEVVEYTFTEAGSYNVELIIKDELNNSGSENIQINVGEDAAPEEEEPEEEEEEPEEEIRITEAYAEQLVINETQQAEFTAEVKNFKNVTANKTLEMEIDGDVVAERNVTLEPQESVTVIFKSFFEPGKYEASISGKEIGTLEVMEEEPEEEEEEPEEEIQITEAYAEQLVINETQQAEFTAQVKNFKNVTANKTVELEIDGDVVAKRNVTLEPQESVGVTFKSFFSPGEYEVSISGKEIGILEVMEEPEEEPEPSPVTGTLVGEQPALTIGLLVLVLVILGVFFYYRSFTVAGLSRRAERLHMKADELQENGNYGSSINKRNKARELQKKADKRSY